ncbi:hypothetical protein OIU79_023647 [Salix purpurea]|uniref:Uncharacterized protein n=1 Tax=Salix purpurea TaxID=77065 RepID=A0A9Q1A991_SALPP|nr:hypothetical protein OIU79_023647 [Salix purpurea]
MKSNIPVTINKLPLAPFPFLSNLQSLTPSTHPKKQTHYKIFTSSPLPSSPPVTYSWASPLQPSSSPVTQSSSSSPP